MERLRYIKLAGKEYALNFSTKAVKAVSERYGGVGKVADALSDRTVAEVMDELIWLLALLIDQGASYQEITGEPGARLTADQLEVVVGVDDIGTLKSDLFGVMASGLARTVEVDPGNAQTTQET